jgi:hypothetical protein
MTMLLSLASRGASLSSLHTPIGVLWLTGVSDDDSGARSGWHGVRTVKQAKEKDMPILLWLLGVPLSLIIVLMLFGVL